MMVVLFDEKKVREIHEYNVRKDALEEGVEKGRAEGIELGISKGRDEGRAEGMEKGRDEGIAAMVATLKELSLERDFAKQKLMQCFHLTPAAAAAKVEQYWN